MNKEEINDILGAFSLINNHIVLSEEEIKDVQKAIKEIQQENTHLQQRIDKVIKITKDKIKRYESYIYDLKRGNFPSSTIRQERQELIFRIREQEELLNILEGNNEPTQSD